MLHTSPCLGSIQLYLFRNGGMNIHVIVTRVAPIGVGGRVKINLHNRDILAQGCDIHPPEN